MIGHRAVAEVQRDLAELKRRWPAHSVKPEMIRRLEELEDELAEATADA